MADIFTRSNLNPLLRPGTEYAKVYNPGAALDTLGRVHLFPRLTVGKGAQRKTIIGHAVSQDGERCTWLEPALLPHGARERRGLEDPRITKINGVFYMILAAYDGTTPRLMTAATTRLDGPWQRQGEAVPQFEFFKSGGRIVRFLSGKPIEKDESHQGSHWSKSVALFPERFGGKYLLLFGEFYLWFATSADGVHFEVEEPGGIGPRKGTSYFDNAFVEMGPPPILTERGWLVLYHGVNEKFQYQLGFLLLDTGDPRRILCRSKEPIFGPREAYELAHADIDVKADGIVPQVAFVTGAVLRGEELWIYYGAGDATVCAAHAPLSNILALIP